MIESNDYASTDSKNKFTNFNIQLKIKQKLLDLPTILVYKIKLTVKIF